MQLKFHPILQIAKRVSDFQEAVRAEFPAFGEGKSRDVTILAEGGVEFKDEATFQFRKADGSATLTLGSTWVGVESVSHKSRAQFLAYVGTALSALEAAYAPILPTRLGLRYINIFDKAQIERDLGKATTWPALIAADFFNLPTEIVDIDGATFAGEISAATGDGSMTVRYGLLREPSRVEDEPKFRFDVDRYTESTFEFSTCKNMLSGYADDIFDVFSRAVEPDLQSWLGGDK